MKGMNMLKTRMGHAFLLVVFVGVLGARLLGVEQRPVRAQAEPPAISFAVEDQSDPTRPLAAPLATFTVTNTNDSGPGSFLAAEVPDAPTQPAPLVIPRGGPIEARLLNGEFGPEWDDALVLTQFPFHPQDDESVTFPTRIRFKHDGQFLYVGCEITMPRAFDDFWFFIMLDRDGDGSVLTPGANDDYLQIPAKGRAIPQPTDLHFDSAVGQFVPDVNKRGTNDIEGGGREVRSGRDRIYRIEGKHPLDSRDDRFDVSWQVGQRVGIMFGAVGLGTGKQLLTLVLKCLLCNPNLVPQWSISSGSGMSGVTYTPTNYNVQMDPNRSCECTSSDHDHSSEHAQFSATSPCPPDGQTKQDVGDPIYLHNGEFYLYQVDLEIPGRGFNWKFERKYRNGISFNGPLGQNWEFNYNRRLFVEPGGNVIRMDGYGRADRYEFVMGRFVAPTGFYTQLVQNPDGTFVERDRKGNKVFYSAPDARGIARLTELRDRNGNRMRFEYNAQGQLIRVIDTLGRPIEYSYNPDGRLIQVRDFFGRSIRFEYDQNGDLVAVTSPAVTGTPTGNDFPQGKTTRYTYSSGFTQEILNHNLLTITAPNEVASGGEPRVRIEYDTNPNSLNVDRVLRQTDGGTNAPAEFVNGQIRFRPDVRVPAGDTISYAYQFLGMAPPNDFNVPVTQTTVTDRNGNRTEYQFNQLGNIVRIREFTNRNVRPSDPEFFETRYEYNRDGEMTRMLYPEGNSIEYVYDSQNPDRFQQGNLLAEIRRPDTKRGGDQAVIRTNSTYEPIYNQVRSMTEARGTDPTYVPQNGGTTNPARYTTVLTFDYQEGQNFAALAAELGVDQNTVRTLLQRANMPTGLGDVNGDGRTDQVAGNIARVTHPTVNLLSGSNMARIEGGTQQPIAALLSFNQFGQITRSVDPEGNVALFDYYPENDPDGDGRDLTPNVGTGPFGYLRQVTSDAMSAAGRNSGANPAPTNIRRLLLYDRVGNVIREVDGRGIATNYVVNQLNQVVQIIRAAATNVFAPDPAEPLPLVSFQYLERFFYDFNNNVIRRHIEDRGNTSGAGGDNSGSGTAFVDTAYQYDILDKLIQMSQEVSDSEDLITRYRYDRNDNPVLVIQPEGNAITAIYDERDLLFQSTRGTTSPPPLALLAAGDPTTYDVRGGTPSTTTSHYDLNGNLIESVDADDTDGSAANNSRRGGSGDRTRTIYDGFDRLTSVIDSVGNQVIVQYDPASNVLRVSGFGPVGGASPTSDGPDVLPMPISTGGVIQATNLVNRNLLAATEGRYDELNRRFQTDRVLFVNTIPTERPPDVADGAADIGKGNLTPNDNQDIAGITGITIIGRVTTRTEYDRNSRGTFTVEDDGDTSRAFYDGADRVIRTVDAEGNIVEAAYDDNNNVIETRSTDVAQVTGVPNEQFLTTFFYDSLNRLQRSVDNIGQTLDSRYDSRNNLVAMADAQGPAGPAITRRAFTGGALTNNTTNRFGNVTLYFYDGINRGIRQDQVLTASGQGDGINIGADLFGVKTAMPTPDRSQGGGDGLITIRSEYDRNSLLTTLTDDSGNQTQYTYDNLDRRLTEIKGNCVPPMLADRCDPPTTIAVEYDPDDNIVRFTDENGSVIEPRFDAINRRLGSMITRAPGVVGTTATTYEYDGLSRRTRATDNNEPGDPSDDSTVTFAYDSLSRLIEEMQQIGARAAKVISSAWRSAGLKVGCTYPNGRELETTYDRLDRLDQIADNGQRTKDNGPIVDYDYIGAGRVLQRAYPINGTRKTFLNNAGNADVGYDGLRRPVQLRHVRADSSLVVGFAHTYDRVNNKRMEEKLHAPRDSELYRYDSAYRLIKFERGTLNAARDAIAMPSANTPLHSNWTLDGVGNWERVDNETRQHSSFNEITVRNDGAPTALQHDDNGNQADDGAFAFAWDYRDRLRTITRKADRSRVATYAYDAVGRRIRKVVTNPGTTDFYYDGWQVVEERNGTDAVTQQYVYGIGIDEPLVLDQNQNGDDTATGAGDRRLFYHQNTLSSVFALTDAAGTVREGYQYDAYGRQMVFAPGPNGVVDFGGDDVLIPGGASALANPYMFTGRRFEPETSHYYYRTRYLDSRAGRFIARDTIGVWSDGDNLGNGYTYAANNPVNLVDPMGMDDEVDANITAEKIIAARRAAGQRRRWAPPPLPLDADPATVRRWSDARAEEWENRPEQFGTVGQWKSGVERSLIMRAVRGEPIEELYPDREERLDLFFQEVETVATFVTMNMILPAFDFGLAAGPLFSPMRTVSRGRAAFPVIRPGGPNVTIMTREIFDVEATVARLRYVRTGPLRPAFPRPELETFTPNTNRMVVARLTSERLARLPEGEVIDFAIRPGGQMFGGERHWALAGPGGPGMRGGGPIITGGELVKFGPDSFIFNLNSGTYYAFNCPERAADVILGLRALGARNVIFRSGPGPLPLK